MSYPLVVEVILSVVSAAAADDPYAKLKQNFQPLPAHPPIPANNTQTQEKVELGKMLFPMPACAPRRHHRLRHPPQSGTAFTDRIPRAIGHGAYCGPRNSPATPNAAFLTSRFWDGRAPDLETQVLGSLQASIEHGTTNGALVGERDPVARGREFHLTTYSERL